MPRQIRYVWNNPYSFRDPYGENPLAAFVALLIRAGAHIAFNPSYVNAPAPCRPVIRASGEFSAGEALGAALGMAGGPVLGKIAGVVLRGAAGAISKGLGAAGRAIGRGIKKAAKSAKRSKAPTPAPVAKFSQRQLDKKFKHAADFGINTTRKNPSTLAQYQKAVTDHLSDAVTKQRGSYLRVEGSKVYFNPKTNNVVVLDRSGNFVTGFKLKPGKKQYNYYMERGVLY